MSSKNIAPPTFPHERIGIKVNFSESTADDFTVKAAVAGSRIRVLGWTLSITAAQSLTWKSGTTAISQAFPFGGAGFWEPLKPFQMYETAVGEALVLTLGSAVQVTGEIWYEVVT